MFGGQAVTAQNQVQGLHLNQNPPKKEMSALVCSLDFAHVEGSIILFLMSKVLI